MLKHILIALGVAYFVVPMVPCAYAAEIEVIGEAKFEGDVPYPEELSGAQHGNFLVVVPDEGSRIAVFRAAAAGHYQLVRSPKLLDDEDQEVDLEGVCSDGGHLFVIGSHSLARKTLKPKDSYESNRRRLMEVKDEDTRRHLWSLTLGTDGKIAEQQEIKIRSLLKHDDLLSRFVDIPSKENGVDIEGLAAKDGKLFVGFRGPVLREQYVPVMVFEDDDPKSYELRFVDLSGRGIRDIAAIRNGFLIIGGPIGETGPSFDLYFWDGKDCLPGTGSPRGEVRSLGTIPAHSDGKAEGIAVLDEGQNEIRALLVYDGAATGLNIKLKHP